jgi:predicted NAD-dependent protein-ADP-ribosyltransferase YbiA (DUF1768 family)
MTGLTLPYADPHAGLANWSTEFPFQIQGIQYPSVNHYIFSMMTNHMDNALLLSSKSDANLRKRFNELSDRIYMMYTKNIISEGVQNQFLHNSSFRSYIVQHAERFFYYIDDNMLWGINHDGYGYNLIGQTYSRLIKKDHSSFYPIVSHVVYNIYVANVLLVQHVQQGNDIEKFVGVAIQSIVDTLRPLYPNLLLIEEDVVWKNYQSHAHFQNIQYEIDYPWNLAGFVRKQYVNQLNYYLRTKFNRYMISKYFAYVLKKRYSDEIDVTQMEMYVEKQISRLSEQKFQDLSDVLFNMYNNPTQNEKVLVFLTQRDLQYLYEIEIQFLNPHEIMNASRYVPFLYKVKPAKSMYIYDVGDVTNIEPYMTSISPIANNGFEVNHLKYRTLVQYIYTKMANNLTNLPIEKTFSLFTGCYDIPAYDGAISNAIRTYKIALMRRGMTLKFGASRFPNYYLYNSIAFGNDIRIEDPDPVFQEYTTKILLDLRRKTSDAYFPVSYDLLGHHIYLQDRVRFRMEDFANTLTAFCIYHNIEKITEVEYEMLQRHLYSDPSMSTISRPIHPRFYEYFEKICTSSVIEKLWSMFLTYASLLKSKDMEMAETKMKDDPPHLENLCSIVSYFIKTFYRPNDNMKFYNFVIRVVLGRSNEFIPSITYFSTDLEKSFQKYLEVDKYDAEFIVNMMGVVEIIRQHISISTHRYLSYWALPTHTPPYPSHLVSRITATAIIGKVIEEEQKEKRRRRGRRRSTNEEETEEEEEQQAEEEEEDMDVAEMLQDLGLEDEEAEEEGEDEEGYETDMETHYGEM